MNNAQVETRAFSESELKLFTRKHEAYLEAAASVNEVIEFLKDQHNISGGEGWQLGQRGFVREVAAVPPAATPNAGGEATPKKRTGKPAARPKPVAEANGAGG